MARPTKLTPRVIEAICDAISIGSTIQLACQYAGISDATFMLWQRTAKDELERRASGEEPNPDNEKYIKFLDKLEEARAQACIGWVQVISTAAETDPNWARWMLEVHRGDEYRIASRQELGGKDGGPITIRIVDEADDG